MAVNILIIILYIIMLYWDIRLHSVKSLKMVMLKNTVWTLYVISKQNFKKLFTVQEILPSDDRTVPLTDNILPVFMF